MATYQLVHWVVKRDAKEGRATVHLHGEHRKVFGGVEKHIDYIKVGLVPLEAEGEIVRCAVAVSPHAWTVKFGTNVSKFAGKFSATLDARLKATLLGAELVGSSGDA